MWNGEDRHTASAKGRGRARGVVRPMEGNPLLPGRGPAVLVPVPLPVRPAIVDVDALARDLEAVLRAHSVPLVVVPPGPPVRCLPALPAPSDCMALEVVPLPRPTRPERYSLPLEEDESSSSALLVSPRDYLLPETRSDVSVGNRPGLADAEDLGSTETTKDSCHSPRPDSEELEDEGAIALPPPPPIPPKSAWALGPAPKGTCWQCRAKGHDFTACPYEARFLYCPRCGWAHEGIEWCPKCSARFWQNDGGEPTTRPKFMTWARQYRAPDPRSYKNSHRSPKDLEQRRAFYSRQQEREEKRRAYRDPRA